MLERYVKLWIGDQKGIPQVVHVSRYDTTWRFIFTIYNGDTVWEIPEGAIVALAAIKADGTAVTYAGIIEDNTAIIDCGEQLTSAAGDATCEVRFSVDGELVSTVNFVLSVEPAAIAGHVMSEDDFSAINQLLSQALTTEQAAELRASISSPFFIARTAADMIDDEKAYVYVGNEAGYTNGGWYYWNGSAWTLGGTAVDTTLTVSGAPADSASVGAKIAENAGKTLMYRGVLNPNATPPVTPDTVTEIGYWVCSSSSTLAFIGVAGNSVFLNFKYGAGIHLQMFVTFKGEVYCRYGNSGAFQSHSDFTRGDLSDPDTTAAPGFYRSIAATTQQYTGENVSASFLNVTTDSGTVILQAFIMPTGKIYSRYGHSGNFVTAASHRQTVFDPQNALTITTVGGYLSVTIPAGRYVVPEHSLAIGTLNADITITQTDRSVYQYGVFNLTSKTGRLASRTDTLAVDDIVLFAFYGTAVDNIAVSPQKFPQNAEMKTINDFFAPMFNRTGTPFKIVLGGDSITHGVGGTGFAQDGDTIIGNYKRNPNGYCWANLFKEYIEDNYNATVLNNGVTGTYSWWWDTYKTTLIPSDTDLFILTLGTNNRIKDSRIGLTHDEQIANYYTQMQSIIEYCNSIKVPILLVSSIPATTANEEAESGGVPDYPTHVYEFNGVLQKLASEHNIEYANLYDAVYYFVQENHLDLATLLPDGLHPGDQMYRIMFYLYLKLFNLAPDYIIPELVEDKMSAYKSISPALTPLEQKDSYYIGIVSGLPQEIYSAGSKWRLGKYSVQPGDKIRISGYAGSSINTPLYVFLDSNGTMIQRYWQQRGADVVDVVVPDNAVTLYANGNLDVESWVAPYTIVTDFEAASEEVCSSMAVKLVANPENLAERGGVIVTSGDWVIDWGRNGWNNLPNLRSALFQGKPAYTGNTDFIGPYAYTMDNPGSDQGDYDWGGVSMFTTGGGHTFFDYRYTIINAYIVGDSDTKDSGWLSLTAGGAPLTPQTGDVAYFIMTAGDYRGVSYIWDGSNYVLPAHPPTKNEGVRTARCIEIKYYADGKEIVADSGTVHCDTFRMVWKNRIQASNTIKWATRTPGPDSAEPENYDIPTNYSAGKECLEECCWVEFSGGGMIRCGVTFKPLVSVHMGWYSGMQAQIHYLYDPDGTAPRYFDANTAKMCYIEQWSHELMEWARVTNDATIGGVTYPAYAGDDHSVISDVTIIGKYAALDMHMDRDYGVARLRWELDAPQNHYFYTGAGTNWKGYMLLVRHDHNNPWPMPAGTLWPWRGYYRFRPADIDRTLLI